HPVVAAEPVQFGGEAADLVPGEQPAGADVPGGGVGLDLLGGARAVLDRAPHRGVGPVEQGWRSVLAGRVFVQGRQLSLRQRSHGVTPLRGSLLLLLVIGSLAFVPGPSAAGGRAGRGAPRPRAQASASVSSGYTPFSSCTSRPVTGGLNTHSTRKSVFGRTVCFSWPLSR